MTESACLAALIEAEERAFALFDAIEEAGLAPDRTFGGFYEKLLRAA